MVEFVGNDWPDVGEQIPDLGNKFFIMNNNGPSIPYDGYIHAFYAQIKVGGKDVRFQIWRQDGDTKTVTLIGEQAFTTTEESTNSPNTTVCALYNIYIHICEGQNIGVCAVASRLSEKI